MRICRAIFILTCFSFMVSCSSSSRSVGPEDGNIPLAGEEGILKDVNFDYDSYGLDSSAKGKLDKNAAWLKDNSDQKVQIEGHCDERGTTEYNRVLGQRRAQAVSDYLSSQGVDAGRMSIVSYGEELPLDPGHNEVAWAKNRRAHFNMQ